MSMNNHINAIKLARRWSVQNENDLMQEDLTRSFQTPNYDRAECQDMAKHLVHLHNLPSACHKYNDIVSDLKRRDTDSSHGSEILS